MKVALLNLTRDEINGAVSHRVESQHDAALNLGLDPQGIDSKTAIDHADDAIDGESAIAGNRHFDRLCDGGDRLNPSRHTASPSDRQRLVPVCGFFESQEYLVHSVVISG